MGRSCSTTSSPLKKCFDGESHDQICQIKEPDRRHIPEIRRDSATPSWRIWAARSPNDFGGLLEQGVVRPTSLSLPRPCHPKQRSRATLVARLRLSSGCRYVLRARTPVREQLEEVVDPDDTVAVEVGRMDGVRSPRCEQLEEVVDPDNAVKAGDVPLA